MTIRPEILMNADQRNIPFKPKNWRIVRCEDPEQEVRRLAKQTAGVLREAWGDEVMVYLFALVPMWMNKVVRDYCGHSIPAIPPDRADKALEEILCMWIWEVRYGGISLRS